MAESDRALIVLDMVPEWVTGVDAVPGAGAIVRFIQGELRYFRERGRPVIFACTAPDLETPPSVIPELTPRADERVMLKHAPSAFFDTDLEATLRDLGVERLTLAGLETHTSVLLTAADAVARGFLVVVPDPCVLASNADDHRFALRQIRRVWPAWPKRPTGSDADIDGASFDVSGQLRRADFERMVGQEGGKKSPDGDS